jgi:hypothetical protein
MTDIFTFWSRIERGAHIHPADVKTFERMDAERHGFHLECLPGLFCRGLGTAKVYGQSSASAPCSELTAAR